MANVAISQMRHRRRRVDVGADPWDARSLEWMIPSPPPVHNFDTRPVVEDFDEFWHRKYGHDDEGRLVRIATTEEVVQKGDATDVHLPSPSYWPIVFAVGPPLIGYGLVFDLWWLVVPGIVTIVVALRGWVLEPSVAAPQQP
jgi:cytochrome c oxidase subunit 1